MVTKKLVENKLREVLDPELGINIVDLGLIYNISVKKNDVDILMTLTFPGCPLGGIINKEINDTVGSIENLGKLTLRLTFDPVWDLSKINQEAREEIGI